MKFPFFASIILFSLFVTFTIRYRSHKQKKLDSEFWEKENLANNTRKKPLDNLNYIIIPEEILALSDDSMPEPVSEAHAKLCNLSDKKIVNLSMITNTDLKLTYGAANLETLSVYDQNYILLIRNLQILGEYYYGQKDYEKAKTVLEFAVQTQSDIRNTYQILSNIYKEEGNSSKIDYLISVATLLPGLNRNIILTSLKESKPEDTDLEESILHILE